MEDSAPSTYNKLVCQSDFSDERPLNLNQDEQQVSLSMIRPDSFVNHHKVLTVILLVLAAILLTVDIGLGVYYRNLTDREQMIKDISTEVAKLQQAYKTAIKTRNELKKELTKEESRIQLIKWELEHQKRRSEDYEKEADKIQSQITGLLSHIPLIKEGCRHCLPGWTLMNSICYYFPISRDIPRRTWQNSRDYCRNLGGDLVVINSKDKQMTVHNFIKDYPEPASEMAQNGYWIGAQDVDEEGVWKFVDGARLTEGYWNDGEPNNWGNEDCALVYPWDNPFKNWNDFPCHYNLKWICEKAPGFVGGSPN